MAIQLYASQGPDRNAFEIYGKALRAGYIENGVFHTVRLEGESLADSIVRASFAARQFNCAGYSVDCVCGRGLQDCCEDPINCPLNVGGVS